MSNRVLCVTNVWNERDRIPELFWAMGRQTVLPKLWLWIDDGSDDDSVAVIEKWSNRSHIPVHCVMLPVKHKGNLDMIGWAWTVAMQTIRHLDFDYMTIFDVDATPDDDYIEVMCDIMNRHPDVGVASGQVAGEPLRTRMCMGLGMFVRWDIVRRINEYWHLSPDSFLNIRAIVEGYSALLLMDMIIEASPSTGYTDFGIFRRGRYHAYLKASFVVVAKKIGSLLLSGGPRGVVYWIAGYLVERLRTTVRCNRPEAIGFYDGRVDYTRYLKRCLLEEVS